MTGYLRLQRTVFSLQKYYKATDVLFCTGFFIYVLSLILDLSMWFFSVDTGASSTAVAVTMMRYLAYAIMLLKIVYDFGVEYKNFGYLVVFAGITGVALITSKNTMLLFYFIVILAARGVSGRMIISTTFAAQGFVLILTVLMSKIGVITDYVTDRHGRTRHFLGFQWATTSALIFLYMVFEYIYLKKGRLTISEFIVLNAINIYLFKMTDSRMAFLIVMASLTFFFIFGRCFARNRVHRYNRKKRMGRLGFFAWASVALPWLIAVGSIYLHKIYVKGSGMDKLNKLLSNRLNYGRKAIDKYGISLFGKKMVWIGYGLNDTEKGEYNYVDCSYLRLSIEYGIIFLALILLICSLIIYKANKNGEIYLAWIMIFILLISVTESRLLNFAFNPFLLMAFASLTRSRNDNIINKEVYPCITDLKSETS